MVVHIQNGTAHIPSLLSQIQKENHTKMKKGTKVQKYRNTKIQTYRNTKVQKYRNTKVQMYRNTERHGNRIWSCILKPALLLAHSTFTILPIFYPSPQNSNVFASYSLPTVLLLLRSRVAEISKYPKETEHLTRWEDFGENPVLSYNNLLH